jgi:DNA adenine methylase
MSEHQQITRVTKCPLRYYGGKWRISKWIQSHFPSHTTYVEPFAGAASVLLTKDPAPIEVLNDLDGDVVNFFEFLRSKTDELIRLIQLTPFSRLELRKAWLPTQEPIERARRFYVRSWQGRQPTAPTARASGWRFQRNDNRGTDYLTQWNQTDHLWTVAFRLKKVLIECDEATSIIQRYDTPNTLHYVDPPYVAETRSQSWSDCGYRHEMNHEQHTELAEVLNEIQGMAILSGYETELYQDLFSGWECKKIKTLNGVAKDVIECLWLSPGVTKSAKQISLFIV